MPHKIQHQPPSGVGVGNSRLANEAMLATRIGPASHWPSKQKLHILKGIKSKSVPIKCYFTTEKITNKNTKLLQKLFGSTCIYQPYAF